MEEIPLKRGKAGQRVLQLAAAGLSNEEIAESMRAHGARRFRTKMSVKNFLHNTLKEWSQLNSGLLAEYREMKLFELEQLKRAVWTDALKGDPGAVREAARIIKMQAEMSGAGAPIKHEHQHAHTLEEGEIKAMEQAWIDAAPIGELPPGEDIVDAELVDE